MHADPLIVPIARALVPGTEMSLRRTRCDLEVGRLIVVVHRSEKSAPAPVDTVGTLVRVIGVTTLEGGGAMVRLRGERLVRIPAGVQKRGEEHGPVTPVDETSSEAAPLEAGRAVLQRYMAARAEAGLGGDVYPQLSNDPVTASHEVASFLQISWPEIQDILEAGDAVSSLRKGLAFMERETELRRQLLSRQRS